MVILPVAKGVVAAIIRTEGGGPPASSKEKKCSLPQDELPSIIGGPSRPLVVGSTEEALDEAEGVGGVEQRPPMDSPVEVTSVSTHFKYGGPQLRSWSGWQNAD